MRDCSLSHYDDYDEIWYDTETVLEEEQKCVECGGKITKNTKCIILYSEYEDEETGEEIEETNGYMCLDCNSIRKAFESNVYCTLYENLWETLSDCGAQVEQSKIDMLTPKAKERVLMMMQEVMDNQD